MKNVTQLKDLVSTKKGVLEGIKNCLWMKGIIIVQLSL